MSWAVIKTGGKQYRVKAGEVLRVEKLSGEAGGAVRFGEVLLYVDGDTVEVGKPMVSGMAVEGRIKAQVKGKKLIIFKFRPKKRYRVKTGHRQMFTEVEITKIGPSSVSARSGSTSGGKATEGKKATRTPTRAAARKTSTRRASPARKTTK